MRDYEIISTDSHLRGVARPVATLRRPRVPGLRAPGREAAQWRRRVAHAGQGPTGSARAELLGRTRMGEPQDLRHLLRRRPGRRGRRQAAPERRWTRTASTPRCCSPPCRANARSTSRRIPGEAYVAVARGTTTGSRRSTPPRIPTVCSVSPSSPCRDHRRLGRRARRVATMPGVRGVVLHQWPNGSPYPEAAEDDRFWALADRAGRAAHRARQLRWWRRRRGAGPFQAAARGRAADQLRADYHDAVEDRARGGIVIQFVAARHARSRTRICNCSSPRPRSAGSPSSRRTPTRTGGATASGAAPTSGRTSRAGTSTHHFQLGLPGRPLRCEGAPRHRRRPDPVVDRLPARAV